MKKKTTHFGVRLIITAYAISLGLGGGWSTALLFGFCVWAVQSDLRGLFEDWTEVRALRAEVAELRDSNKALFLGQDKAQPERRMPTRET